MTTGFALRRNGTCLSQETNCGTTATPFSACCPHGSVCANPYNQVCCDSTTNCTESIVKQPKCGNPTWTLYNNGGVESAYFCCLNTSSGYAATATDSNGCASPGYVLGRGEVSLQMLVQAGSQSDSSSTSNKSSSISPGTIAGATVGAILGLLLIAVLAFYFIRRRRSHSSTKPFSFSPKTRPNEYRVDGLEIGGQPVSELAVFGSDGREKRPTQLLRAELP